MSVKVKLRACVTTYFITRATTYIHVQIFHMLNQFGKFLMALNKYVNPPLYSIVGSICVEHLSRRPILMVFGGMRDNVSS